MSLPDHTLVQGDLAPAFQKQLLNPDGKTAPDLTGKTLTCRVKPENGCRGVNVTTLDPTQDYIDRKAGFVQHRFVAPETDQPGILLVAFNDGSVTYPEDGWYTVKVTPKLL